MLERKSTMTQKSNVSIKELLKQKVIKLDLGGGDHPAEGYTNVDIDVHPEVQLLLDVRELDKQFPEESVDQMLCRDTLQCFRHTELPELLRKWCKILKPRGKLVIQCYDIDKIIDEYKAGKMPKDKLRRTLYGSQKSEHQVFVNCFDEAYLRGLLTGAGFEIGEVTYPPNRVKIVAVKKEKEQPADV